MTVDSADDVEESTPFRSALFESVHRRVAGDGFALKATRNTFVRRHEGMGDHMQLVCLDAKPGYRIQPHVGVRIDRVEDIFHQTSGFESQYQNNTATMGAPVGALVGKNARACEFLLETESDIASVTEQIVRVFREVALPYYERWHALAAIDAELNDQPVARTRHRSLAWFRCSTGIIVAKLVGRPDYQHLADVYREVMTRDNKGFYMKYFQPLLTSLESVAAENLKPRE